MNGTLTALKPQVKTLRTTRFKPAEFVRQTYHAEPQAADTVEDVLMREYWVHFAPNLKGGDKIELLWEDRSLYAEAIIMDADKHGASIAFTVQPFELNKSAPVKDGELYEVKWAGPHAKWRVHRLSDDEVMQDHLETKEQGDRYIKQTLRAA